LQIAGWRQYDKYSFLKKKTEKKRKSKQTCKQTNKQKYSTRFRQYQVQLVHENMHQLKEKQNGTNKYKTREYNAKRPGKNTDLKVASCKSPDPKQHVSNIQQKKKA